MRPIGRVRRRGSRSPSDRLVWLSGALLGKLAALRGQGESYTTGDDDQGNGWTTSRWRDIENTTVKRPSRPHHAGVSDQAMPISDWVMRFERPSTMSLDT